MVEINGRVVRTSDKIDKLPDEFVAFAIENRSANGNFYWNRAFTDVYVEDSFQLENIELIDRVWNLMNMTHALSLRFAFTHRNKHGVLEYSGYYVNLAEGEDIYPALVDIDLKYAFPFDLRDFIQHWNHPFIHLN